MDGFTVAPFGAVIPERAIVYAPPGGDYAVFALLLVLAIIVLSSVARSRHLFERRRRRRRLQLRSAHV